MKFNVFDYRGPQHHELSDEERKPWRGEFRGSARGAQLTLLAPDGTTRTVLVEIDKGDLRVCLFADVNVSAAPAAEIVLKSGSPIATLESMEATRRRPLDSNEET